MLVSLDYIATYIYISFGSIAVTLNGGTSISVLRFLTSRKLHRFQQKAKCID